MRSILLRANNLEAVKDFRDCPCPLAPKLSRKRRTAFSADFLQKCETQSKSFHRNRARRESSFLPQQIWRQIEGNGCAKSVTKRHYAITKFGCCVKNLISTQDTNWRAVLVFGSVFRPVLRLCLTPERMRTALTPNHWTRKSTALCPPTLLTAQRSKVGKANAIKCHTLWNMTSLKKEFKNVVLFPNVEFHLVFCYKIKCFKNRNVHLLVYSVVC